MTYNAITDQIKETVMNASKTQSGAELLSCEMDAACPSLDCNVLMKDYTQTLQSVPEAAEMVAHFCGLDYLDSLTKDKPPT
jgi:hypothetical protein